MDFQANNSIVRLRIGLYNTMTKKISHKPPRFHQDNSLYFLTFCTFNRVPYLLDEKIPELLINDLHFYAKRLKQLVAYTIMPDHVHLIVEVEDERTLSSFLRDFKKRTSKKIKRLTESDSPIWQHGTMDHCIRPTWSNKDFKHHLQYLFYNSWKHLEIAPKDFPYHNFKSFVDDEVFTNDFCTFDESQLAVATIYE